MRSLSGRSDDTVGYYILAVHVSETIDICICARTACEARAKSRSSVCAGLLDQGVAGPRCQQRSTA